MIKNNEVLKPAKVVSTSNKNLTSRKLITDANDLSTYDAAKVYLANGLSIIPISLDGSKVPAIKWKEYQNELPSENDLNNWFNPYGESFHGIGIVTGEVSGSLEVLDIESRFRPKLKEFFELIKEANDKLFSKLVIVETGSKGLHIYYRCGFIENNQTLAYKNKEEKYIETRGEGGYVIAPGSPVSVHPTKQPYRFVRGSFDSIPSISSNERDILLDCARSFNEYIKPDKEFKPSLNPEIDENRPGDVFNKDSNIQAIIENLLRKHGCRIEGNRVIRPGGDRPSATIFKTGVLHNFSTSWNQLESNESYSPFHLYSILEHNGDFSLAARELYKHGYGKKIQKISSDLKLSLKDDQSIETIDDIFSVIIENLPKRIDIRAEAGLTKDIAPRMKDYVVVATDKILETAKALGFDFRFSGNLYVYNTQYWLETDISRSNIDSLTSFVSESAMSIGLSGTDDRFHTFIEHLCKQFLACVLSAQVKKKRNDSVLINFKNGTLEILGTGYKLRDFDKQDFLTYQLSFDFDPKAMALTWDKFLNEVLPEKNDPNKSRQKVLSEYFASCFTELNLEKSLFLFGSGANGKSVIFKVISSLFGDQNISYCTLESLMKRDSFLAAINNKLLNYSSETSPDIDAELLKQLASKEPITVARKYENPFQMQKYARLAFNSNELPKRGKEYMYAFKRRLAIVPFDVMITPEKADPYLADKIIKDELPGVMNWLLDGLARLLLQGKLTESNLVDRAVDSYMNEGDVVAQWLEDREWIKDENLKPKDCIQLKDLHKDYIDWCKEFDQKRNLGRDQLKKRLAEMHNIQSFAYRNKQYYKLRKEKDRLVDLSFD